MRYYDHMKEKDPVRAARLLTNAKKLLEDRNEKEITKHKIYRQCCERALRVELLDEKHIQELALIAEVNG